MVPRRSSRSAASCSFRSHRQPGGDDIERHLLQESLAETGIDFMAAAGVHKVSEGPPFTLSLDNRGELKADAIVVAAGRIANTEGLALENAGSRPTRAVF